MGTPRRLASMLALMFCASWSCVGQSAADCKAKELASSCHEVSVPFRLYWGYLIVVRGSVGTLHEQNLIIDTGAHPSVVDFRVAKELGLEAVPAKLAVVNQTLGSKSSVISELQIGPVHARGLPVLIQDLSFLEKALGTGIAAIIGLDVLSGWNFVIDYRHAKIIFGPFEPLRFKIPFESGPPLLTVRVRIQDLPLELLVDTASPNITLFASSVIGLGNSAVGLRSAATLGGTLMRQKVVLSSVRLGRASLGPRAAFVVQDQHRDLGFQGLLPVPSLGISKIGFDFDQRVLSWQ